MYLTDRSPHNHSENRGAMVAQQKGETLISPMKTQMSCSLYGTPQVKQIGIKTVRIDLKRLFLLSAFIPIKTYLIQFLPLPWRNGGANHFTLIFELWHR